MKGLPISESHPCFVIAEIGQNHQGDVAFAKELITLAKDCGANCVKFQKSSLPHKFTRRALDAPYDSVNSFGSSYGEHKTKLELSNEEFQELQHFAEHKIGIMFTASAMDKPSADFLISLNVPFIKIGSGDTNNFQLIDHIAQCGKPIVLSTGMQDLETVKQAVRLIQLRHSDFAILHCVSAYPTPLEDVNLSVIDLYKKEFPGITIGYSGHELGILISIAAVALGAKIIERHFTKDKALKGTDHRCSLNPIEFKAMVDGIREVEKAVGLPIKKLLPSEIPCQEKLGKSIVAACPILKNSLLTPADLYIKVSRPKGISPQNMGQIIGKRVNKDIDEDSPVTDEDLL